MVLLLLSLQTLDMFVFRNRHCHNCTCLGHSCPLFSISQLPLLSLSDRVPVVVDACCCGVPVAPGGKDVMVTHKDVDTGHVNVVDGDKGLLKRKTNKRTKRR